MLDIPDLLKKKMKGQGMGVGADPGGVFSLCYMSVAIVMSLAFGAVPAEVVLKWHRGEKAYAKILVIFSCLVLLAILSWWLGFVLKGPKDLLINTVSLLAPDACNLHYLYPSYYVDITDCLAKSAVFNKDPTICNKASSWIGFWKEECVAAASRARNNSEI